MMSLKIILLISSMIYFPLLITDSYGHGVGFEIFPPVKLGDKMVALEVTSSQYQPETPDREITFTLIDMKTGISVRDVTFDIVATKKDQILFENTFATSDGILVMDFLHSDSDKITIKQENKASIFDSLIGGKKDVIQVTGKQFNTGGLYNFKVLITTADSFSEKLEEPIKYNVGLSIPQRNFYDVNDPNFGTQQLSVVTYYDEIEEFQYNSTTKSLTFSMPFEWSKENVNQTSVVHEELTIPKTFGDLMVSAFSVKVNNIEIPENAITIDEFSEVQRIVHIVLNQKELLELYNEQKIDDNKMNFLLKPQRENLPLSTVTGNGQFRIVLDWEPKLVNSGSKMMFNFDIMDIFLKDRPVSVSYNLSIVHDGKVIFTQNGISTGSKNEHNKAEFIVPENVKGVITIQFDNLDGNSLARVGLPIVVDRVEKSSEIIVPNWIRNMALWWSDGKISDNEFINGIQFLINEKIIQISAQSKSTEPTLPFVPNWIKDTAGWWGTNKVTDRDFINGIKWLIENGVLRV